MENSGGNMCRCCASEGVYKDLNTTYHWMGEEEVYGDMLKDCFNVQLSVPESSDGGICEVCITQLRNAINFKKQVLLTEEQFKKHVQKVFKTSIVKVEALADDDSTDGNVTDDGLSEPEFDEVPIKTEHVAETVTVEDEIKPKKRAAPIKASTSRTKKSKSSDAESPKKRTPRRLDQDYIQKYLNLSKDLTKIMLPQKKAVAVVKVVQKKADLTKDKRVLAAQELGKQRHNVIQVLKYTNASPIRRYNDAGYLCCFCTQQYKDPADLKAHTAKEHNKTIEQFMKGVGLTAFSVKLDITNLKCKICDATIEKLEGIYEHLTNAHEIPFHVGLKNHILPFKFNDENLRCTACNTIFGSFKSLQEHMYRHFGEHSCDVCGSQFMNAQMVRHHKPKHLKGSFACSNCAKTFDTARKRNSHERSVHVDAIRMNKCSLCNEKFKHYHTKMLHLKNVHGRASQFPCQSCDQSFATWARLSQHIRKFHLMLQTFKCAYCEMSFGNVAFLRNHMVAKHNGAKKFQCGLCSKMYVSKKTLRQHIRIHMNDRRYKCAHCGEGFVQKTSLSGHLKTKHGILSLNVIGNKTINDVFISSL